MEVRQFRGQEKTVRKLREGPGRMERKVTAACYSPPDAVCPHSCHTMGNEDTLERDLMLLRMGRERAEPRG